MSKIMETVKEIIQAAAVAFDPPPESFTVVDEYGNEWTYVQERTCKWTLLEKWDNTIGDDHVYGYETECGAHHTWWPNTLPDYCPSCGARVVE